MALTHLRQIKGLILELDKCLHKDTTTKISQTASGLPYCAETKNAFSMLSNGARLYTRSKLKVNMMSLQFW